MMPARARRRLVVTVRAASDVSSLATNPYVILELGDQSIQTSLAIVAGTNPVWDEPIELLLPPPLPNDQPLQIRVRLMNNVRLFPDKLLASGSTLLSDMFYGGGQHEVTVPLTDKEGQRAGRLFLGLRLIKEPGPGEDIGSAAGTVLGEVLGGGPESSRAGAVPGVVLPSAERAEMQAREVLGAGNIIDPSKPGFGLNIG